MKRIIAVILAITLALGTLSGCALKKKLTAFGLYTKAVNTIREAGGVEADCVAVMDLSLLSVEIDMNIKQNGEDGEITVAMGGEQVSKTTTVGGMVYVDAAGTKTRYPKPAFEGSGNEMSAIPKLAENLFTDIEIVEDENGGKALTVSIGSDVLASLFDAADDAFEGLSFENAALTMYFDPDDNIESMHLDGDAVMEVMGFQMTVNMVVDYTFKNLGTAPEINVPENAEEYILVDISETDNT